MKIEIQPKRLKELNITPNQFFIASLMANDVEAYIEYLKEHQTLVISELNDLYKKGHIEVCGDKADLMDTNTYSIKGIVNSNTKFQKDLDNLVKAYLEIFPVGVRSGGKLLRSDFKSCVNKMGIFLKKNPQYNADLILKVTKAYVDRYAKTNYEYIRTAVYFIDKKGEGSTLAEECAGYLAKGEMNKSTIITPLYGSKRG